MNFLKILLSLVLLVVMASCKTDVSLDFERPFEKKVGIVLPLSTNQSARDIADGMAMAVAEFNASQGKDGIVEFFFEDIGENKNKPLNAISRLTERGVRVFCVGFDKEIIMQHKMFSNFSGAFFNFFMSYPPATIQGSNNSTRMFFNVAQEADIMAEYALKQKGSKTYVILSEDSAWGKSAGDFLNFSVSASDRKVFRDYFTTGEKSFDIFAKQILYQNPKAIFYVGDGCEFEYLENALKRASFKGILLRNRGMQLNVEKSSYSKVCLTKFETCNTDKIKKFKTDFQNKFSRQPSIFSAWGYDSANHLIQAMYKTNFTLSKMRKQFCNVEKNGVVGTLKFDSSADCTTDLTLK